MSNPVCVNNCLFLLYLHPVLYEIFFALFKLNVCFYMFICILCVLSDGWGLSVQVLQESSLCWRKESILGGVPGPTARVAAV